MKMILMALVLFAGLVSQAQSSDEAYVLSLNMPGRHGRQGPRLDVYLPTDLSHPAQLSVVNFMEVVGNPDGSDGFSYVEIPALQAEIKNVQPRLTGENGFAAGDGLDLDLGKSGKIYVLYTGQGQQCVVQSTVREFDFAKPVLLSDCSLYLKPGASLPKPTPGVTGSN